MFDKKFKIVLVIGILVILGIIFGRDILNSLSSVKKISTLTDSLTDSKALSFYKKSCDYEDGQVCNELGDMYHYGNDMVSVDYDYAVEYYRKSCALENGKGCNNLAYMLNEGKGIEKNNWNAIRLYKKACKYNEIEACYNVGSMYYNGEGTRKNYPNAAYYFKKSCDNGLGAGCNNLGYMYEHGQYLRASVNEAMSKYLDACDMGTSAGCNNLAELKEKKGNLISAKQFYRKACLLGDNYSCNKLENVLGTHIYKIKNERELEEAKSACNASTKGGTMCYRVGLYYESQDETEDARLYFEKACQREQSQSCKHLGDLYR